jgi:hypothetical protein
MQRPNISYELVLITPDVAADLLNKNIKNRKINRRKVNQYAKDMINGDFQYNGHTVCISNKDVLLDGQQRLTASVQTDLPFWTLLIQGLDESVMTTIDSGRTRTYSDRLKIRGYTNYTFLASALTHICMIAQGTPKNVGISPAQLDKVLEAHPLLADSVAFVKHTYPKTDSILSAVHYIGKATGHEEKANEFIRTWKDGQINYKDDPVVFVRELFHQDAHRLKKMTTVTKQRLIVLSWNKFKDSLPLTDANVDDEPYSIEGWDTTKANFTE